MPRNVKSKAVLSIFSITVHQIFKLALQKWWTFEPPQDTKAFSLDTKIQVSNEHLYLQLHNCNMQACHVTMHMVPVCMRAWRGRVLQVPVMTTCTTEEERREGQATRNKNRTCTDNTGRGQEVLVKMRFCICRHRNFR